MAMVCTAISNPGFLGLFFGLWDGITAVISLVLSILWDVRVYNICSHGWWYDFGFLTGILVGLAVGLNNPGFFLWLLIVVFIIYLIIWMFGAILWGIAFGIGCLIVYMAYKVVHKNS